MTPRKLTALHLSLQLAALVLTLTTSIGWVGQSFHGFRLDPALFVSIINSAHWEGPKAGIQPEDQIQALDGVRMDSYEQFEAAIRSRAPGDSMNLEILRGDATQSLSLRVQAFTWGDWRDTTIPVLFLWLVLVAMATVTHLKAPPGAVASMPLLVFQGALALYVLAGVEFDLGGHLGPLGWLAFQAVSWSALMLALAFPTPVLRWAGFPVVLRNCVGFGSIALGLLTIIALEQATRVPSDHRLYTWVVWQGSAILAFLATVSLLASLALRAWRTRNLLHRRQAQITLVGALVAFL
ncbi:MAG: PDZ domain-containing protein, partial [Candidatus Sericytochromatia bacterium]|nr:PDZ domain-containing protein [Candidatus Tanganyikabacteria bacterium]